MIALFVIAALATAAPADSGAAQGSPTPSPAVSAKDTSKAVPHQVADLSKIPSRNPFDPHHQPWNYPPAPPPPAPPLADNEIRLHGAILAGNTRKALVEILSPRLLEPSTTGKPQRPYRVIGIGDDVGGYRVTDITTDAVVFEQGGRTTSLPFVIATGRSVAGAAVPAPEQVAIVLPVPVPTIVSDEGAAVAAVDPNAANVGNAAAAQAVPQPTAAQAPALQGPISAPPQDAAQAPVSAPADANQGNAASGDSNAAQPTGMSLLDAINWARTHNAATANPPSSAGH